jgi:hypothetical protein
MSTIVTRAGKGSPLTHTEVDNNFTNLNTDKLQSGSTASSLVITSADINGGTIDGTAIGSGTASTGAFTTATASTSFTSPVFKATNSAGGALQNSSGTNQLQWGGGGGNNLSVDVAININPANAQVAISPTGTGSVTVNPATAGTINNMSIGATTASTGSFTNFSVTGTTSFDGSEGTAGQLLTSAGSGNTPTWTNAPTGFGFKNRIINGDMRIDQRRVGTSVTIPNGITTYSLDRWAGFGSATSKFSIQQNAPSFGSVTPPTGFTNYLGCTSLSAYSVGSSETYTVLQSIEGFNTADLAWGTASASPVTLSFWVRSSLTGTFGGYLANSGQSRSYPFSYVILAANTWEQKTITIAGDTTGTWLTNNGIGIQVGFSLGTGSTLSGTAGTWSGSALYSVTGATSVVGTNGATFYITGVQLEKGSTATSFDVFPYTTELQLCQRYYTKTYLDNVAPASTASPNQANSIWQSVPTTNSYPNIGQWFYPVTMRATPTIVIYNTNTGEINRFNGDGVSYANAGANTVGNKCVSFYGANVTVGTSVFVAVHATADAEL